MRMQRVNITTDKNEADKAIKKSSKDLGINSLSALIRYLLKGYNNGKF